MSVCRVCVSFLLVFASGSLSSCDATERPAQDDSSATADDEEQEDSTPSGNKDGGKDSTPESEPAPKPGNSKVDAGKGGLVDSGTKPPGDAAATDGGAPSASAPDAGAVVPEEPAVACNPADKKPDPTNFPAENIQRYRGMKLATPTGPYGFVIETDPAMAEYTIYRPMKMGEIKHPIMVWANGGCSKDGTYFSKWLMELVSHGFVVVSDGTPNGSGSRSLGTNGEPQIKALDWIIAENERPCSQYYHKLDVAKTAASGQSCGGLMSLGASGDKRLTTVVIFNSGMFSPDEKIYQGLHAPMAYFIGGMDDVAYPQAESDVKAINNVPLFYGNLDVGHFATWSEDNAGEFGRVGVAWFKWRLMGDAASEKMFVGADCELCKAPSKWTVQKKMMQ
jgi:hypothetical protein